MKPIARTFHTLRRRRREEAAGTRWKTHSPRNADTPVRAVLAPHNGADRSVRVTTSAHGLPASRAACEIFRPSIVATIASLLLASSPTILAQEKTMTTSTGAELVWIPPGEFMLGSTQQEQAWAISNHLPPDLAKREGAAPRHVKIANGFWLSRTEMTVGQWRKFADATGYLTEAEKNGTATARDRVTRKWAPIKGVSWRDPKFDVKPKENYPVCCISWNDAIAYCQWATDAEKKANKLPTRMICRRA